MTNKEKELISVGYDFILEIQNITSETRGITIIYNHKAFTTTSPIEDDLKEFYIKLINNLIK